MLKQEILEIKKVETVEVIRVTVIEGDGTDERPLKEAVRYWEKEGRYIGELDSCYLFAGFERKDSKSKGEEVEREC